jgi:hypothetical protein
MDFVNANRNALLAGDSMLPGKANHFPGPDKRKWHANIPTYSRVKDTGVYPGVDLSFYGNQKRLEYDFVLQPQADPGQIKIILSGSDTEVINQGGDLVLSVGNKSLSLMRPVVYQLGEDGQTRQKIEADYRLNHETAELSFAIGAYDHSRPLIIDPVLTYSESLDSNANAVAADSAGNTYVASGYLYGGGINVTKYNSAVP